jgi:hypothetical protein
MRVSIEGSRSEMRSLAAILAAVSANESEDGAEVSLKSLKVWQ